MYENLKWKKTSQDRFIQLFASSENLDYSKEKSILIVGGVHGDEPEGVYLAEALLHWVQEMYQKRHTLRPWVMIPCLNPDGYSLNQRVNGNGVDLNRNFPSQDWSKEYRQDRYYPGRAPGSEPETQALVELIKKTQPKTIIHCHSWKPSIVYTGNTALPLAQILADVSGYALQSDIGYPTPGSLGQYGYLECKTGVICIEEREGASQEETWARFAPAFEKILLKDGENF